MGLRDKLPEVAKRLAGEFVDAAARFPGNEADDLHVGGK